MIAVRINGSLREYQVGRFPIENAEKFFVMRWIDDGAAVMLAHKNWTSFQDGTSFLSFTGAEASRIFQVVSAAKSFSTVQVEKNHLMAGVGVASRGPAATALRIAGMASGNDNLQFARLKRVGTGRHNRGQGRSQFCRLKQQFTSRNSQGTTS